MLALASTLATGGGEKVLAAMLLDLARRGSAVELLLLKEPGEVGEDLAERGIPVHSLGLRRTRDPRILPRILRRLRAGRHGLLFIQDHNDCLFWGRLAAALAGWLPALSPAHRSGLGELINFTPYNRLLLGLSPQIVILGDWQRRALRERERLSEGFWVRIPNPVDGERYHPHRLGEAGQARRLILGTVAALRPEKRQDRLLRLAAHLSRRYDLELRLLGDGPERTNLEALAQSLGLAERVRFLGRREDVAEQLREMDLFCLTSREEALPLSVLEAMACGVPVAATPWGAVPELLDQGRRGLLLRGDDPAAWSRQVEAWLDAGVTADQRLAWAESVLEEYSLTRFNRRYQRLLDYLGLTP